jgi:hypothetical protein
MLAAAGLWYGVRANSGVRTAGSAVLASPTTSSQRLGNGKVKLRALASPHWTSLAEVPAVFQNDLGSLQVIDARSLPILSRLSIKRLTLAPGAIREPQWNVNANQLAHVVRGQVLVSLLADADEFAS